MFDTRWGITPLKHLLSAMGSGGTPASDEPSYWAQDDNEGVAWVSIGDMSSSSVVAATAKRLTAAGLRSKRLSVWPKDTLLMSMYASLGHVARLSVPAATNQAILALHPDSSTDAAFLMYWLKHIQPWLASQANSNTQDNLNAEKVGNLPATRPPLWEQIAIVGFLDYQIAKIDALIAEQQRLIELLKEKRQAVISQAVTKGLDPNVPMKDSGVEWLGEVPEHWLIGRLKNLVRIRSGHDYKHVETDDPDGFPVIGSGGLFARATNYLFDGESVLLGRKGTIDKPLYVNGRFWTVDTMFYTEINESASAKFVYYAAMTIPFAYYSTNTALPSMSQFDLANHLVAIPPYSEQQLIADFLSNQTSNTDALVAMAEDTTKLLTERRSALISAAVTGKIDVRNWQPPSTTYAAHSEELVTHG